MVKNANLLQLIRFKIIDECLQQKKHTIQELRDVCIDAVEKYDNAYPAVTTDTISNDIKGMTGNKLHCA